MSAKGVLINVSKGNNQYKNNDAFGNCVKYACKEDEHADKLIGYRFFGVPNGLPIEEQIEDAYTIQKLHDIDSRNGRRAAHMIYSIQETEFGEYGNNPELFMASCEEMARSVFDEGHQVFVATHYNENNNNDDCAFIHAHIIVNNINYVNGKKYHKTKDQMHEMERCFNEIQGKYQRMSPVTFKNADYFRKIDAQYQALYSQTAKEQAAVTAYSQQNH